jgi:hypothetical protein
VARPLTSHEVIVNTIAATTTRPGLTVRAEVTQVPQFNTGSRFRSHPGQATGSQL